MTRAKVCYTEGLHTPKAHGGTKPSTQCAEVIALDGIAYMSPTRRVGDGIITQ
jgi:hypothetical protein